MAGRKKYYRIGEVSRLAGVDTHTIRYWESVFPSIKPRRVSGQRLYRSGDLDLILRIKTLLHEEGFTVAGAKKKLAGGKKESEKAVSSRSCRSCDVMHGHIMRIRADLAELLKIL